jgi:hypothetical protein
MTATEVLQMKWYKELIGLVQTAASELTKRHDAQVPVLISEKVDLERKIKGWSQSLADPELPLRVRGHTVEQCDAALTRVAEIEWLIQNHEAETANLQEMVDPADVAERLDRLAAVLATTNPSAGSVELAHHIDRIDCYSDGRVVLRTCKLGALAGAVDFFSDEAAIVTNEQPPQGERSRPGIKQRRLSRRRLDAGSAPDPELKARAIWAANPRRFSKVDSRWFYERVFQIPKRLSWAEKNAPDVAARRKLGHTEEQLAEHFGKSLPTIRASLKIARKSDPELLALPRRMPRARWHEEHALEVAAQKAAGKGTNELVKIFGKSDTTIRAALNHAKLLAEQQDQGLLEERPPTSA